MTRPPNDRNQGRKPIKEGQATVSMTIRLTARQREKLADLGGAKWLRERIDRAKSVGHDFDSVCAGAAHTSRVNS